MTSCPLTLVTSARQLEDAVETLTHFRSLGVDTETTALDPFCASVRLLQIATPLHSFVFDLFQHDSLRNPRLRDLLQSPEITKVFHNAKFDLKMLLHHFGLEVRGVFDTLLASQLVGAGRSEGGHGLSAVTDRHLGELVDKTLQTSNWSGTLSASQYEYAARDAALMLPLREKLASKLADLKLDDVAQLEFDCVLPLAAMELAGMQVDPDCWRRQVARLQEQHDLLSTELRSMLAAGIRQLTLFGEPPNINLDSPAQIVEALENLGIKIEGTRSWQLQPLVKEHPVVGVLLEYRSVQKLLTSYGNQFIEHIHPATGRVHADFRQLGAAGGRM